jgi:hypothetical protein
MCTVLRHVGMFVFFTSLSSAQTLSTGSLIRSSYTTNCQSPGKIDIMCTARAQDPGLLVLTETLTSKLVPSTWRMCLISASCAWKLRTTFQALLMMLIVPSRDPRNRLSEPVQTLETSPLSKTSFASS